MLSCLLQKAILRCIIISFYLRGVQLKEYKLHIVLSDSIDPAYNLSFEEWLLENADEDTVIMYLWQNRNSIVIGRNQNPWKECRLDLMKNENVQLVRRLSGGGTVYHDLGNLNFTFIAHKDMYDTTRQTNVILRALKGLGIEAEYSARNDLLAEGRKFSGTAYINKKAKSLHHGTLLVDADLDLLERYLSRPKLKIQSRGVDSVRSKVINLNEVNKDLTIEILKQELVKAFQVEYNFESTIEYHDEDSVKRVVDKARYDDWDWNFSESPSFSIQFENDFGWGNLLLDFNVKNGLILNCQVKSDSLDFFELRKLEEALIDTQFRGSSIIEKVDLRKFDTSVIDDIKAYVLSAI